MTTITAFYCPINDCAWTHEQPMTELPDGATEDDLRDLSKLYNSQIEDTLREHYTSHPLEQWIATVGLLNEQLRQQHQPQLLCLGCYLDRYNAQKTGEPLPPQNHAQLIVNGNGQCLGHIAITDTPQLPGRSAGGLLLPGQTIPPNGGINGNGG